MNDYHIGVTGSRDGFRGKQSGMARDFIRLAAMQAKAKEQRITLHDGCCVGVDLDFLVMMMVECVMLESRLGLVLHPGPSSSHCALTEIIANAESAKAEGLDLTIEVRERLNYAQRNRNIVACAEHLFGFPPGPWTGKGGTWMTLEYMRKAGKPYDLVMP